MTWHSNNRNIVAREIEAGKREGRYKDCAHLVLTEGHAMFRLGADRFSVDCRQDSLEMPSDIGLPMPSGMRPLTQPRCPKDCHFFKSVTGASAELDDRLPLLRRGVFDRDLAQFVAEAQHRQWPLSLVMLDLDHFKAINDTHGHPVGDEVLMAVAEALSRRAERKGRCYRYGGEEMAVLLPNYTPEEAAAFAELVRRDIEGARVGARQLSVTASFGVACLPAHVSEAAALLQLADAALYEAKDLGRNYVRVSGEPRPAAPAPRPIERRQPEPGGWTETQKGEIRAGYFQGRAVRCPADGAALRIHELHDVERLTPDLLVACPLCGVQTKLPGQEA